MPDIRIAIAGVGNCASALIQGIEYYRRPGADTQQGLMQKKIGGYRPTDIKAVAAFDVDARKVGLTLDRAIFAQPNCADTICADTPPSPVVVEMAPVLDGVAPHMADYPSPSAFRVAELPPVNVAERLCATGAEVLV